MGSEALAAGDERKPSHRRSRTDGSTAKNGNSRRMGDCIPIHRRRAMCFMTCVRAERPEYSSWEELLSRQAARRSRIERPTVSRVPTGFRLTMHSVGRRLHSSSCRAFPCARPSGSIPGDSCDHGAIIERSVETAQAPCQRADRKRAGRMGCSARSFRPREVNRRGSRGGVS
jgi:hypothetical protein